MKKVLIGLMGLLACALAASADTYTFTADLTNGVVETNAVAASGWLDKIEVCQEASRTTDVVVATFNSDNATICDVYCTNASQTAAAQVYRPRVVGSTIAGVALAAVTVDSTTITNGVAATTVLSAPYERKMIGGNTQIKISSAGAGMGENTVKVTIFYEPLKR